MADVIYLLVPAEESEKARRLGAHWDPVESRWFIRMDQDPEPFLEWLPVDELETEETPELCLAAPVFVVETVATCRSCGSDSPVITLAAERFSGDDDEDDSDSQLSQIFGKLQQPATAANDNYSADFAADEGGDGDEDEDSDEDGGLMRFQFIEELPGEVVSLLGRRYPFFRKRPVDDDSGPAYFVNQCSCGEAFEDLYLHSEPGVGFYLFNRKEALKVVLRELPIDGSMLIRANFGIVVPDVILKYSPRLPFPADS